MKKNVARLFTVLMVMACMLIIMMALGQTEAHAAFNDRTPAGAITMPANRTMTIPANKAVKINFGTTYDYTSYYYFKIKPTKTGTIKFTDDYTTGYRVVLCNSSKKVISKGDKSFDDFYSAGSKYAYQKVLYYGVKKGVTYYIRVKGASTYRASEYPYIGSVMWSNKASSQSKYGKKKSKAKAIKKKKTVKGLFTAGNKKGQWYKITNKQKTTKIIFKSPRTNGTIKVKIYYKSLGHWYNSTYSVSRSSGKNPITGTISKKVKHTYYLKVFPDGKSSGNYTLMWK